MTKIVKSHWNAQGQAMTLTMPLSKVDKENRLVSGFATLDNLDTQGDIVLADASLKAFSRARGNIREQHDQYKAVGKMVDFREDEFYDSESDKFYRGIYVTAYISKGAEDTWQKVLDGTLSGFSIGGSINDFSNEINKESGKPFRIIKDYDLTELSLVDNPANQLASVFSIQKADNGSVTVKGMVAETQIENVFFCPNDGEAQSKPEDSAICLECGQEMENIGWFEVVDDRLGKVREIVNNFVKSNEKDDDEGGVTVTVKLKKNKETEEGKVEQPEAAAVETNEEIPEAVPAEEVSEVEETEEETEKVSEVEDDEEKISKAIDDLKNTVTETLNESREETQKAVQALEARLDEVAEKFEKKASELEDGIKEFGERLETAKGRLAEFEKALTKMNKSSAVKKSADVESEEPTIKKSKWNGAFSINNLV
jgi:hypothetical protein